MNSLSGALVRIGLVLILAAGAGTFLARALMPRGPGWRAERLGWGFAAGVALLAAAAGGSFLATGVGARMTLLVLVAVAFILARRRALPRSPDPALGGEARKLLGGVEVLLFAATAAGVALYALRALTEPMWSGDFLAIWGLKGKSLFGAGGIPAHLLEDPRFGFAHPEYPLGLPLLYAGLSLVAGGWEDHALALLFPGWQIASLLVAFGWLRRRGAPRALALGAAAVIAHFGPLYSAFLTGIGEVPVAFAFLLLGTSFADAMEGGRGDGALRRLALASLLAAATKNEGLFMVAVALCVLLVLRITRRAEGASRHAAAALLLPAALSAVLHRLAFGKQPVRDFDLAILLRGDVAARFAETAGAIATLYLLPNWPALLLLAALILLGRSVPAGDRTLALAGGNLVAYLLLPVVCVHGPRWLVTWSVGRTAAALAPLAVAAVALRLTPILREVAGRGSSESAAGPRVSAASPAPGTPSTPAS